MDVHPVLKLVVANYDRHVARAKVPGDHLNGVVRGNPHLDGMPGGLVVLDRVKHLLVAIGQDRGPRGNQGRLLLCVDGSPHMLPGKPCALGEERHPHVDRTCHRVDARAHQPDDPAGTLGRRAFGRRYRHCLSRADISGVSRFDREVGFELPSPSNRHNRGSGGDDGSRSEEHTSELQSPCNLVCRLLLEKKNHQTGLVGTVDESVIERYSLSPGACSCFHTDSPAETRAVTAAHSVHWDVFFFNDTATTEIYTLSLHDALPICPGTSCMLGTHQVNSDLPCRFTAKSRSEEHTSELQSPCNLVCRLLLEKKK